MVMAHFGVCPVKVGRVVEWLGWSDGRILVRKDFSPDCDIER